MTTEHLEYAPVSSNTDNSPSSFDNHSKISSFFMLQCLFQQKKIIAENSITLTDYLRKKAQILNDFRWVYGLYGLLDGVSTSFSMLKYAFDIHYAKSSFSSADMLHDFLLTPEGIVLVVIESLVLAGFAASGNVFDDDAANHEGWKKWSAILWRYVRDALKGLKNAYKGIRNLFFLLDIAAISQNISYLILPLGLALGALLALNRMFIRYMRDERKGKMKTNKSLLDEVNEMRSNTALTPEDWEKFRQERLVGPLISLSHQENAPRLQEQSIWQRTESYFAATYNNLSNGSEQEKVLKIQGQSIGYRVISYLAATYSGLLDAPYLYLGAVSLAVLNPPFFIVIASLSVLFLVVCIATRIFEEYNYQRLLRVSQTTVELAVCTAELRVWFNQLEDDPLKINDSKFLSAFESKLKTAAALKDALRQQSVLSTGSVILGGLRNGMDAYSALASLMFVIATILLMLSIPYPPLLLVAFGSIGVIFLAGFVGLALTTHWEYLNECSLMKMSDDPGTMAAEKLKKLLNKKPAYVLFNSKLYYLDRELNQTELHISDMSKLGEIFTGPLNMLQNGSKENLSKIKSLSGHSHLTKHSTNLSPVDPLSDLLSKLKNTSEIDIEEIRSISDYIDRLAVTPSPQNFFQEWLEVFRLLCSGGGKGIRTVDETMVAWQDVGDDGHYHDTSIMATVAWACAGLFGISFALRGFARLGRKKDNPVVAKPESPSAGPSSDADVGDSTTLLAPASPTGSVASNTSQNDDQFDHHFEKKPITNLDDKRNATESPPTRPVTPLERVGSAVTALFFPPAPGKATLQNSHSHGSFTSSLVP